MYKDILFSQSAGVARITFNRPEVLNALSPNLIAELTDATQKVALDESIKVLIVTGIGRAWSAGVDLQSLNDSIQEGYFSNTEVLEMGVAFILALQSMPQVTIAQVNGHCYTGAMELMLAFDLVYAADEAQIGDTHTKWGIAPKWGMTQRLQQKVGLLKAMEMSFTAEPIKGQEAARIGLVNQSVPLEELEEKVSQVAEKIKANSAQTIAAMKKMYYFGAHHGLHRGLEYEWQADFKITDREQFLRDFKKNK
ncbi:enoyl-CoA hydratase/isomerase family protein [Runella sp. MFBS21]|uniref:enoyl-CoA hydratase/isomerase family protein n=1 Tax=Runella sp. MFBS21 TaxID=3034018 RepID=UPI0023F8EDA4|nr:enoyl-CoA hydratase/isomerase family protein [Runella sp. MFBS21]MDF7816171.1 enoyl-CoA hydratase/isomerase family protein [Runella sp. MFBS21]